MELLVLWYGAQAAQQRLRNTFRNSSEPNKELTLNSSIKMRTPGTHRCGIGEKTMPLVLNDPRKGNDAVYRHDIGQENKKKEESSQAPRKRRLRSWLLGSLTASLDREEVSQFMEQ
jgi:hypothetical protein